MRFEIAVGERRKKTTVGRKRHLHDLSGISAKGDVASFGVVGIEMVDTHHPEIVPILD